MLSIVALPAATLKARFETVPQLRRQTLLGVLIPLTLCGPPARLLGQGQPRPLLERVLIAEDARGTGKDGVVPILEGISSRDPQVRLVSVRALGRLQRGTFASQLAPALDDNSAALRAEAANALAQSVQSVPRAGSKLDSARTVVREVHRLLLATLAREADFGVVGALVRSIGRLPVLEGAALAAAEDGAVAAVARLGGLAAFSSPAAHNVALGLYAMARARRTRNEPALTLLPLLRNAASYAADAAVRRAGLLGLTSAGALDTNVALAAQDDADAQVRRLALAGSGGFSGQRREIFVLKRLVDDAPLVRVEAIRALRQSGNTPDCAPIVAATRDPAPHVALAAIDALGGVCSETAPRVATLRAIAESLVRTDPPRVVGKTSWHAPAHALVALARVDRLSAMALLPRFVSNPRPQVREYSARAAAIVRDTAALNYLFTDANNNVRESAITGIAAVRRHEADSLYLDALKSPGNQVVRAAAAALAGSGVRRVPGALLEAFERLSATKRENTRDARVALLTRLQETGNASFVPRLTPFLSDFDSTIAQKVGSMIGGWKGEIAKPTPLALPIRDEPLARTFDQKEVRLRITMSTGDVIVVRLFADEATATVARMVRLAREKYYDGLTFHRVEPTFVLQGGSPDANEYMGDGPFMRDELGLRSHDRYTLGISTRGRDTGDAQFFINTQDNPRLDHDYTVVGEVVSGHAVVDDVLEGDIMVKVEVVASRP